MGVATRAAAGAIAVGAKTYSGTPCKHGHSGLRRVDNNACVECHYARMKRYRKKVRGGLTYEQRRQRGLPEPTRASPATCEICGCADKRALSLDHCHGTGRFRGWLCSRCNMMLGKLGDNLTGLEHWFNWACAYLRKAEAN